MSQMSKVTENWTKILDAVRSESDASNVKYDTWLRPLKVCDVQENVVTIMVPGEQIEFIKLLNKKYRLFLEVAIAEIAHIADCEVKFVTSKEAHKKSGKFHGKMFSAEMSLLERRCQEAGLTPRYTFENFVVGNNNKFAHAAAVAVAESPGNLYNPLFLYGGAGLGKTHLMHSTAREIIERYEDYKVLYVTSDVFTNELIESIRSGSSTAISQFRDKYRNIDVLLVDDIQFIIGKESTQEEFFHTFNNLYGRGKQVILSSDKPPRDMTILEERMRSRFEWGLTADISAPDYETRTAILQKKMEMEGCSIDEEVINYIAANIKSNIRELEGALNKVIARSRLEKKDVTMEMAEISLRDTINKDKPKIITPEFIISIVADHFHVKAEEICGSKRNLRIVIPRQIVMFLCRELLDVSYTTIGMSLGGRDHSTVMHGIERIENEMGMDENIRKAVEVIKKKINP